LNSELDYEQQQSYIIVLSATDQALKVDERLFTTVTVHIRIEDQNDIFPKFISTSQISIWETEPLHSVVHVVMAADEDSGENGRVTYRITNGNEDDYFFLNESNGHLSLVNSLAKGIELTHFVLNISATDHGIPPKSIYQLLQVMVQELYTSRPQFLEQKYEARIQENSLIGTEVLRITAFRRNQSKMVVTFLSYSDFYRIS
jgi:protocadherin-16/23